MGQTILVTGAAGNLGREVVTALLDTGYAVKAAARDTSKIVPAENQYAVRFDYTDPTTHEEALADATGLFLVAPPMDAQAADKLIPFIEKAKSVGVEHIVFTSALGMDQDEQAPLRVVERALMTSGVPYTILRPNFFMENFSTGFIGIMIEQQSGIFLAAGNAKTSFISTRDVAAVAAAAFAEKRHGQEHNLTGPEALDHIEAARLISEVAGRKITYHALPEAFMLMGARDQGMPEEVVQYVAKLYSAVRGGQTEVVTDGVEAVIGRKPETFEAFTRRNGKHWQ